MNPVLPVSPRPPFQPPPVSADDKLREAAKELEATFLSEMLKSAGLGELSETFGGGPGEFASFLRLEQARAMVEAGGIGLAETLFEAMKERADGAV